MGRIYAISKFTDLYSDHIVASMLSHYFDTVEEAQKYLSELADDEFGSESFYNLISDNGEIERNWSDYCDGIYLTIGGKRRVIEYRIITLRSFKDYKERMES